jgi:hypothetical protein
MHDEVRCEPNVFSLEISTQFQQEEICNFKAWRITFVWKVPGTVPNFRPPFTEECKFENLNFAALELVTFNQIKNIWTDKKMRQLTEASYF